MKSEVTSTTKRLIARAMKFTPRAILISTQSGDNITIARPEGVPEDVQLPKDGTVLRDMALTLSGNLDKLYGFYPSKGLHVVQFHSFQHRKNELPAPVHLNAQPPTATRKFPSRERDIFNANLIILEGDYAGCLVPWSFLPYAFDRDVDGTVKFKGSKNEIEKCAKFLQLCGFDTVNEILDYSTNILPDLEPILSERADANPFQIALKISDKGSVYVDTAEELPAGWGKRSSKPVEDDPFAGLDEDDPDEVDHAIERSRAQHQSKAKAAMKDLGFDDEEEVTPKGRGRDVPIRRQPEPDDFDDFDDEEDKDEPPAKPAPRTRKAF